MWVCRECESTFDEPIQYSPDNIDALSWEDFDMWGDDENEDCCPYCYSLWVESVREDDEWEEEI